MTLAYSFFVGLFLTIVTIPLLAQVARRAGILDLPEPRKVHSEPTPRVGGIALAIGCFVPVAMWLPESKYFIYFGISSLFILLTGVLDNALHLNYKWKLAAQTIGVAILLSSGFRMLHFPFFGIEELPAYISYPVTFIFFIGITNAVNLFDGLDGLAGGCTVLSIAAIGFLGILARDPFVMILAAAIIGGIFGFLRYNAHPATVFMGDAGSQFLGFAAGFLAIYLTSISNQALSPALPFLILGLPILDTVAVIARRILQGRSPFIGDRQHLHHRLLDRGLSHVQTVGLFYAIQIALVATAIITRYQSDIFVVSLLIFVGVLVIAPLYFAETKSIRFGRWSGSEVTGSLPVSHDLLSKTILPLGKIASHCLTPIIIVFLLFGATLSSTPTEDVSIVSIAVILCGLVGYFVIKTQRMFFIRLIVYFSCLVASYILFQHPGNTLPYTWLNYAFVYTLIALVMIAVIFGSERRFRVAPQDLLMLTLVITVPILPGRLFAGFPVAPFVLQVATLFYSVEYEITAGPRIRGILVATGTATLGIVALRGLL